MKRESLKGHLDVLILSVLADQPMHGYAVIEQLRLRSNDALDLAEGTVYPVLHRLEHAGMLASGWSEVGGRRRRTYRLTRAGTGMLERERDEWRAFARTVDTVLNGGTRWPATG
jgi:PadR family transcriptional regulator, regulatory protein PadR